MSIEWLKAKVARLEEAMGNRVMAIAEFTTLSRTSAAGDKDFANVAANPNDRHRPIRRVAPWGLMGYPPAGVLSLIVKAVAGVFNGVNVGIATDKYGPQSLKEGETALYCSVAGVQVLLDKNGAVTVTDGGGNSVKLDGTNVIVNGGALAVARQSDPISSATAGPYAVTPQVIQSGAPKFKA